MNKTIDKTSEIKNVVRQTFFFVEKFDP